MSHKLLQNAIAHPVHPVEGADAYILHALILGAIFKLCSHRIPKKPAKLCMHRNTCISAAQCVMFFETRFCVYLRVCLSLLIL